MDSDEWVRRWWRRMLMNPWAFSEDLDDMVSQWEKDFAQFEERMSKWLPKELIREREFPDGSIRREVGPIVYGYSITLGPHGKPVIREFGNIKPRSRSPLQTINDKREPLVDVVDSGKEVKVIAELPGINKEDIDLTVDGTKLIIEAGTQGRKYHKRLDLPKDLKATEANSKFNNGVLEITFPKETVSSSGVRLKVE